MVLTKLRPIVRKEIATVPLFFAKLFDHYPSASSIKCPSGLKLSSMKIKSLLQFKICVVTPQSTKKRSSQGR